MSYTAISCPTEVLQAIRTEIGSYTTRVQLCKFCSFTVMNRKWIEVMVNIVSDNLRLSQGIKVHSTAEFSGIQ